MKIDMPLNKENKTDQHKTLQKRLNNMGGSG